MCEISIAPENVKWMKKLICTKKNENEVNHDYETPVRATTLYW